jgi:hypothetical protein
MSRDWFTASVGLVSLADTTVAVCVGLAQGIASGLRKGPYATALWPHWARAGSLHAPVVIGALAWGMSAVFCAAAIFWPGRTGRYAGYQRASAAFNLCVLLWLIFAVPALSE